MNQLINLDLLYQIIGQKEEKISLLIREIRLVTQSKDKTIGQLRDEIQALKRELEDMQKKKKSSIRNTKKK